MVKKKHKTAQQKRSLKSIGFIILLGLILVSFLFNLRRLQQPQALWGDGTDSFYKQLIVADGEWKDSPKTALFDTRVVSIPPKEKTKRILSEAEQKAQVLSLHTAPDGTEKWIEIDLSDFKLYAWEGNRRVFEFSTSTGRSGFNTPTGEFRVWRKVLYQRYVGGSGSGYYNLPNVPYSLFFGGGHVPNWKGYSIHGAYWHNDFGIKNRSSGCVNLKPEEAGLLYAWAGPAMQNGINALNSTADNPGVRVVVHE